MPTRIGPSLALLIFVVAWGCAGPTVRTDFDPAADFSAFKTYAFAGLTDLNHHGVMNNSLLRKRLEQMMGDQLTLKGLRRVGTEEHPDLLVHYWVAVKEKMRVSGAGPYWRGGMGGVSTYNYQEGTLIIDLLTPRQQDLVWRASMVGILADSKEDNHQMISKAMAEAFANYPPHSGKP